MNRIERWAIALAAGIISLTTPCSVHSQAIRLSKTAIRPNLVCVLCSLTVTTSPSSVNFALAQGGVSFGSTSVAITTTMSGITLFSSISLFGYFASASSALSDSSATPNTIPSSAVWGLMPTGSPSIYKAFTQSGMLGTPGATLLLFTTNSMSASGCVPIIAVCRTDNLSLKIDLTNLPQLPAGTYTGALVLQAEVL